MAWSDILLNIKPVQKSSQPPNPRTCILWGLWIFIILSVYVSCYVHDRCCCVMTGTLLPVKFAGMMQLNWSGMFMHSGWRWQWRGGWTVSRLYLFSHLQSNEMTHWASSQAFHSRPWSFWHKLEQIYFVPCRQILCKFCKFSFWMRFQPLSC